MQRKEPRILIDAEILVKLAYLTISEDVDLKNLETLRLSYEQNIGIVGEETLELTPLEELRRLCEQVLASEDTVEK
ncbi:MAG: hypothetical protein NZ873_00450 [Crenarchaeota archaeon]|nr:hypothetical protein [Thermoproteota archaeon]MDW8033619.1 hypothetical protein [Nitrososphaerota archaeon]